MWYEIMPDPNVRRYNVLKIEAGKAEIVFQSTNETRALRAYELIDKHGHGALRYPQGREPIRR